jgi:hypothetical protein
MRDSRGAKAAGSPAGGLRASIIGPAVDFLSVGGLSLLLFVPFLLAGRTEVVWLGAGAQAYVAAAINMPHFLASYRLVYRDGATMRRHPWAAFGIPALLLVACLGALREPQLVGYALVTIASVYLAWHYTGQVWGMMAVHAQLQGVRFDTGERRLVKGSLHILLAWHVAWFLVTQLRNPAPVRPLYLAVSAATVVAVGCGVAAFALMRRRTGRMVPLLVVTPWLALLVWYAAMARDPRALFWVQIAHALQYLAFPLRMEANAHLEAQARGDVRTRLPLAAHLVAYAVLLLAASWGMAQLVPVALMGAVGRAFGEEPGQAAPILLLACINIHHYFTDGVLWKLRNPEVQRQLFAHVARGSSPPRVPLGIP